MAKNRLLNWKKPYFKSAKKSDDERRGITDNR